jgi:hypothetical protein
MYLSNPACLHVKTLHFATESVYTYTEYMYIALFGACTHKKFTILGSHRCFISSALGDCCIQDSSTFQGILENCKLLGSVSLVACLNFIRLPMDALATSF